HWSNFRPRATLQALVGHAHRRHWVEQYHEEAKGLLGWDQYQGRLWRGFHRNAVCVMLAYSFLVWQEFHRRPQQARRGRPRRAFSPSEGPPPRVAARGTPADLRLATCGPTTHRRAFSDNASWSFSLPGPTAHRGDRWWNWRA